MTKASPAGADTIPDPDAPAEDPAGAAPDGAGLGSPAVGPAPRRQPPPWALAAIGGLAALALVMALLALNQRSHVRNQQSRDADLRRVSGQLVGALTTYDYQHLDGFQKAVLANATGAFRQDFNARFPALRDVLVADHSRAFGTAQAIVVGPVQG